jgi:hypothetical protein
VTEPCPKLAQITYKFWHDEVTKVFHQKLAKKLHLLEEPYSPYYKHEPQVILEKDNYKLYCNHTLLMDKTVPLSQPDITLNDRINKKTTFVDIATPLTHNLEDTVTEKQCKHHSLPFEVKQQWQLNKITAIPLALPTTGGHS